jgi:aryl carrier-like protein
MDDWEKRIAALPPDARERLIQRLQNAGVTPAASREQPARLVAFYTTRPGADPAPDAILRALEPRLPRLMIPREFVRVESIPRLPNGKVDRRRLAGIRAAPSPAPSIDQISPTEQRLIDVWKAVLHRDSVSVTDDFFDLGGDSIHAMQILSRLKQEFPALTLAMLFDLPTLRQLAAALSR